MESPRKVERFMSDMDTRYGKPDEHTHHLLVHACAQERLALHRAEAQLHQYEGWAWKRGEHVVPESEGRWAWCMHAPVVRGIGEVE